MVTSACILYNVVEIGSVVHIMKSSCLSAIFCIVDLKSEYLNLGSQAISWFFSHDKIAKELTVYLA